MSMLEKFTKIRLLAFDLDGVLTNGKILLAENGNWLRQMDIKDGFALQLAVKKGLKVVVISGSNSLQVEERLNKLGVKHFFQNVKIKSDCLSQFAHNHQINAESIMFMGDDIPDLSAFTVSGLRACPADACQEIKEKSDYISTKNGGDGCVREIIEKVMRAQGIWDNHSEVSSI